MVNSTERSDILVFNCYLRHVKFLLTCYVCSTKICHKNLCCGIKVYYKEINRIFKKLFIENFEYIYAPNFRQIGFSNL